MSIAFPLIIDPYFYAVSVPAVLLLGVGKSGFGAGLGSLAVPMMALAVSVPRAAAILMPVLFVMDLLGMAAFRKSLDLRLLRVLLPFGLVGVALGAVLFKVLDARTVAGVVGACTLLFLAQRLLFAPRPGSAPPPRWLGGILTVPPRPPDAMRGPGRRRCVQYPTGRGTGDRGARGRGARGRRGR